MSGEHWTGKRIMETEDNVDRFETRLSDRRHGFRLLRRWDAGAEVSDSALKTPETPPTLGDVSSFRAESELVPGKRFTRIG